PAGDLAYHLPLQRTKRHVLDAELLAVRPFVFHRRQGKDSVVISHVFVRFLFLRQQIVEQVRSDPDDLWLADAIVNEFVIKAFRDEFQHLISLLLAGNFFVALLFHFFRVHPTSSKREPVREGFEPSVPFWGTAL